ncbi:hypothetical protein EV183_002472 [Coemansia sp. RSA 2336]|nr:hypothetical protein EV183_002472 [Coemansia sp. RSA 2336]
MVLQWYQFGFPWLVTAVHSLGGIIGMRLLAYTGHFTPVYLDYNQKRLLWIFSALYTVNIAVSNVSLHYVSVPLHQVVRGTVPVFTVMISLVWKTAPEGYSWRVYASLVPVVLGVGLSTYGDYYSFTIVGFLLTLLGTILAATKTVVTNTILVGGYQLKLSALDLLYQLSPLAFVQTIGWAVLTGELFDAWEYAQQIRSDSDSNRMRALIAALVANGAIAFVLNISSFTASKNTSALAMTVAGNVKVVLAVVVGCMMFQVTLSPLSTLGVVLTICGGAAYSAVKFSEAQRIPYKSLV